MQDLEMKKKIAQEIIDLMDQKGVDQLKSKSPKFTKAKIIEVGKVVPTDENSGMEMMKDEKKPILEDGEVEDEEMSPEMIKKLIEMMNGK